MQIIIVGCGKVGRTLAEQLQEEDTDITLIDSNPDRINAVSYTQLDVYKRQRAGSGD